MNKRYIVRLSEEERETLQKIISTGEALAYKIRCQHSAESGCRRPKLDR